MTATAGPRDNANARDRVPLNASLKVKAVLWLRIRLLDLLVTRLFGRPSRRAVIEDRYAWRPDETG